MSLDAWERIREREAALEKRIETLEAQVAELEQKWLEDHTTLYLLLNQQIDKLQSKLAEDL